MTREHDPAVEAVIDSLIGDFFGEARHAHQIRELGLAKGSLAARVITRLREMLYGNLVADAEEGECIADPEHMGFATYRCERSDAGSTTWVRHTTGCERVAHEVPAGALLLVPRKTEERLTHEAMRAAKASKRAKASKPRTTEPRAKTTKPRRSSPRR